MIIPGISKRNDFIWYVKQFLLTPYFWGGDDPMGGIDCSGLVVEGLKGIGELQESQDRSADGLLARFYENRILENQVKPGCLVFWIDRAGEKAGKATHVAIFINTYQIIHATGGGSKTDTLQEAIDKNAYVKIRGFEKTVKDREARQTYIIVDPFEPDPNER